MNAEQDLGQDDLFDSRDLRGRGALRLGKEVRRLIAAVLILEAVAVISGWVTELMVYYDFVNAAPRLLGYRVNPNLPAIVGVGLTRLVWSLLILSGALVLWRDWRTTSTRTIDRRRWLLRVATGAQFTAAAVLVVYGLLGEASSVPDASYWLFMLVLDLLLGWALISVLRSPPYGSLAQSEPAED